MDRYKVLRDLAQEHGKTRLEILNAIAPSWNLSPLERARMEDSIRATAEPPTKAQRDAVVAIEAARADAAKLQLDADRASALAYRNAANPFHAAQLMNATPHAITRGLRVLRAAPPDDEPPPSAA